MANAREIAVRALIDVNKDGSYSNITLNNMFSSEDLTAVDKSLATTLFYGVLDRMITLDYVLSLFIKTPVKKLSPITREALRTALYQIMYMDRIPQSASVNEAVKIVKSSKERYNAPFVNGVLRNVLRTGIAIPQDDSLNSLEIRYSCPKEIIKEFIKDYGIDTAKQLLSQSLLKPPVTLRVNNIKTTEDKLMEILSVQGVKADKTDTKNALIIDGGIDVGKCNAYKDGLFHIEDLACQKSIEKLSPKSGERVLDMCAAPGGKSFTVAEIMGNNGEVLSFDKYEKRAELINKGKKRLGLDIIKAGVCDAQTFNETLGLFDAVLCDVPCSGLGVIRRKPEIKYKGIEDFLKLQKIQSEILNNASRYLKTNGRILYSTCTLRRAENEDIVKAFLDKNTNYELQYEHTYMPHIDGTDGFYCALIKKSR
ncbi:MAG: 16S rRNA (cytosine(967)-C(5))-methyltransferase RsmB [Clostridia bacterium]|nr:16S rRNA (cytosine(967)-C(5))-methyltransferase RsmB [Clostridia bacterium]